MPSSRVTDGKLSDGRTLSSTFLTGARQDEPLVRTIEARILRAVRSAGLIAARRLESDGPMGLRVFPPPLHARVSSAIVLGYKTTLT